MGLIATVGCIALGFGVAALVAALVLVKPKE